MRCLADFILDSDLCFKEGAAPFTLNAPDNDFSLTLSNIEKDAALPDAVLSAQLIFESPSFENIRATAYGKLGKALNCLTYTTNRKFVSVILKRVIDWTPGIVERDAIVYVETPEIDGAEAALDEPFLDTAERLLSMQADEKQYQAMRWYRLGIEAENLEEQFSYFWFALEIAAETLKGSEQVPSKCPTCKGALFCEQCGTHPTHRRYSGEAIQNIVQRVHPHNPDEVFLALQTIRHALMHGRRIESVAAQLPCTQQQALNKLAFVTWNAIWLMFSGSDPRPEKMMNFGYSDNLVRRTLVGGVHITTTLVRGDPNDPQLSDFPFVKLDVIKDTETEKFS